MKESIKINAFDTHELVGTVWRNSASELSKGIIILVHGMAETIERYDEFATFLSNNDFIVYGINQRGHGPNTEMHGFLGEDGWFRMKEDLKHVLLFAKSIDSELPVIMIGHSMGSFVVRDFLIDYSYLIKGVVLSGTGFPNKLSLKAGKWLASRDVRKHGSKHVNLKLDRMIFGSYNKRIPANETPFDWLSRDKKIVASYIADDYCGNVHPSSFFLEFSMALERILSTKILKNINTELQMLVISGDADPVGDYGKGVDKTVKFYLRLGFAVQKRLYADGRHEMLNEIDKEVVFDDILLWLNTLTN